LNYTSPPPLINYDQSLIAIINKYEDISQSLILMDVSELLVKRAAVSSIYSGIFLAFTMGSGSYTVEILGFPVHI
jgi:hypothetical protein